VKILFLSLKEREFIESAASILNVDSGAADTVHGSVRLWAMYVVYSISPIGLSFFKIETEIEPVPRLWLANCYFARNSLRLPALLPDERRIRPCLDNHKSPLDSLAAPLSSPVPDAGDRLIYQRLALVAVFGRPLQNFQEIVHCFPIAKRFPIVSLVPGVILRSISKTQFTLTR
jgi:hypothetical protein